MNLNDSPLCGEFGYLRRLARRYGRERTYVLALCSIDADMFNFVDESGRRDKDTTDLVTSPQHARTPRRGGRPVPALMLRPRMQGCHGLHRGPGRIGGGCVGRAAAAPVMLLDRTENGDYWSPPRTARSPGVTPLFRFAG